MGFLKPKVKPEIAAKRDRPEVRAFIAVPVSFGLPAPEGTLAQLYYLGDQVEIDAGGVTYHVPLDRVRDISIQADSQVETYLASSAGGAVAGAFLAGVPGALIGGRVKKVEQRTTTAYLVITYMDKQGAVKCLGFDVTHTPKAADFPKLFQAGGRGAHDVEL